jgi:hypothetical protein
VNPLDWAILGIGALVFIFSFIDFYSGFDVESGGRSATVDAGTWSAWHDIIGGGFFSWFAMLLAIVGAFFVAAQLFMPAMKMPIAMSNRVLGLLLFALALLFEIIGIFVTPGDSGGGFGPGGVSSEVDVSLNHGFGFWFSLILILAGTVLSLMRVQQSGEALPGPLANMPNIGNRGPQGGLGGGGPRPGPGPGTTPPPPGYGPPQ